MLGLSARGCGVAVGIGEVCGVSGLRRGVLVIVSMMLFAGLVQRLNELQINNVLYAIGDSGREVIRTMFQPFGERRQKGGAENADRPDNTTSPSRPQVLRYSGPPRTITSFDVARLVGQAQKSQCLIVTTCAVGDTLVEGTTLLEVQGAKATLPEDDLLAAIHLAKERTFEQDPKYPIRLLVDIAIRALSPAINDPTTAVQTIDQIEDLLRRLGQSDLDVGQVRDASGTLRLVYDVPTWEDYLALAFDEIRQYGTGSVQVMRRLRSALVSVAGIHDRQGASRHGDAISRPPRPGHRPVVIRSRGPHGCAPRGPARHRPIAQKDRIDDLGRREQGECNALRYSGIAPTTGTGDFRTTPITVPPCGCPARITR